MYNKYLPTFLQVANLGSFSKAASTMFISSVSIMKQINILEAQIGVKLFKRTSHGVELTSAGRVVYSATHEILLLSERAISQAQKIAKIEDQHVVTIGSSFLYSAKPLLALWVKADNNTLPVQANIIPFDDDFENLQDMIQTVRKEIDCIWGPCSLTPTGNPSDMFYPFESMPCRIAVPPGHRLAQAKSLELEELGEASLVLPKFGASQFSEHIHYILETQYPEIRIIESSASYSSKLFAQWVRLGYFVVTLDIWADAHPRFVTLPVNWDCTIPYGIVCLREPSAATMMFINAIFDMIDRDKPRRGEQFANMPCYP